MNNMKLVLTLLTVAAINTGCVQTSGLVQNNQTFTNPSVVNVAHPQSRILAHEPLTAAEHRAQKHKQLTQVTTQIKSHPCNQKLENKYASLVVQLVASSQAQAKLRDSYCNSQTCIFVVQGPDLTRAAKQLCQVRSFQNNPGVSKISAVGCDSSDELL